MIPVPPSHLKFHEQADWFEALSLKEKQAYIRSQNPKLERRKCPIPAMRKKYGEYYWGYSLDNGWSHFNSSTKEETMRRHLEFMNRVEEG